MTSFLMVALVWCVIWAFLCAAIAQSKGHPPLGWFIFGALLGVIAFIMALVLKPEYGPPQPPGWYADPWHGGQWRWWDGYQWTWQTSVAANAS